MFRQSMGSVVCKVDAMKIISNHLVFKTDQHIPLPEVKQAGGYTAVPFTLHNASVLRNIGLPAPSPIVTDYDWPGKFKPYKHQVVTAEFATLNKRAFILNGLGSGKSLSALWAADYLKKQGIVNRVLIVSPLSTLDTVWAREIFTNFPGRSFAVLHGTADKRKKLLSEPVDFLIVNHHGVGILGDELKKRLDINLIIIDECACYRNSQTKMHKALRTIIRPDTWVWGMTGSPTPQAPTDAYGIAKLISPESVPYSFTRCKNDLMIQCGPFRWVPRKNTEHNVAKMLSPSIRFALRDCLDLPETIMQYRKVELTAEQKQHYSKLLKECVTEVRGTAVSAVNAAVLFGRLLQCAAGVMYGTNKEVVKLDFSARIREVLEIIEGTEEKVIVFVPFTAALHAVKTELVKHGYHCGLVEGDTSRGERQKIFDEFQFGDKMKILCGQPGSMSHGLTLTAASCIIWFSPVTSHEIYEQSCHRIIRSGQKNVTNIINIMGVREEERVYKGLVEKKQFMDTVLEIVREQK